MAVLLVAHRYCGVGANLRHHVHADFLDLPVELVAQHVGPGQAVPCLREIAGLEQRQQPLVFLTEIAAQVAVDVLDPVVDPAEPGVVGRGGGVVDDRIDQGRVRPALPDRFPAPLAS